MRDDVHNTFNDVPDKYKVACCKTMYTYRLLRGMGEDRDFSLQIYNAVSTKLESEFGFTIDDKIAKEI